VETPALTVFGFVLRYADAKDNTGNKYRAALASTTDCNTFPQCFIGGVFFGGAADACMKWKSGDLQPLLEVRSPVRNCRSPLPMLVWQRSQLKQRCLQQAAGVKNDNFGDYAGDSFEFLPKWMSQNPLRAK
jgi:hypothetical protein